MIHSNRSIEVLRKDTAFYHIGKGMRREAGKAVIDMGGGNKRRLETMEYTKRFILE